MSALYQTNIISRVFYKVLAESPRVQTYRSIRNTSRFRAIHSVLLSLVRWCCLLNGNARYTFHSLWFNTTGAKTTVQHTRGEQANHLHNRAFLFLEVLSVSIFHVSHLGDSREQFCCIIILSIIKMNQSFQQEHSNNKNQMVLILLLGL